MSADAATAIDRYLNELCWAMGGTLPEHQAVREELRAHIRDATREASMQGADEIDALRRVLADLGDPSKLGREMRGSRRTPALKRALIQPEGALVLSPRRERHLPHPAIVAALGASAATAAIVAVAYAWPG